MADTLVDRPPVKSPIARPPFAGCPKCGDSTGFLGASPTYIAPVRARPQIGVRGEDEHLLWSCRNCGYSVPSPTLTPS